MWIAGSIDRCDAIRIGGWIFDLKNPDRIFHLDVIAGGEVIGHTHTGLYRADLEAAGFGAGTCAFRFEMPPGISPEALRDVRLRVSETVLHLLPTNATITNAGAVATGPAGDPDAPWIDQPDWIDRLGALHRAGTLDDATADRITRLMRDGYVIIPGAVPQAQIDALNAEVGAPGGDGLADVRLRRPDLYRNSAAARQVCAAPEVLRFIAAVLEAKPKVVAQTWLRQSDTPPLRKDSATMRILGGPRCQLATWLALEDVVEGNGPHLLLTGSHRAPPYLFRGTSRAMEGSEEELPAFERWIREAEARMNHQRFRFYAKAGDVLIRHADVAHTDGRTEPNFRSRRALVTYYTRATLEPSYRKDAHYAELDEDACAYVSRLGDVE